VYDLDGTLVELDVDWDAVRAAVAAVLRDRGVESEGSLWDLLRRAGDTGNRAEVEAVIADHEREGARRSRRLPLADDLPTGLPTGVCSLNCEAACRVALDRHGLADHVDAVVGRDTVSESKPDPAPLLRVVERIGADPATTLFVGDSESDEVAAERAGLAFQYVADRTG